MNAKLYKSIRSFGLRAALATAISCGVAMTTLRPRIRSMASR